MSYVAEVSVEAGGLLGLRLSTLAERSPNQGGGGAVTAIASSEPHAQVFATGTATGHLALWDIRQWSALGVASSAGVEGIGHGFSVPGALAAHGDASAAASPAIAGLHFSPTGGPDRVWFNTIGGCFGEAHLGPAPRGFTFATCAGDAQRSSATIHVAAVKCAASRRSALLPCVACPRLNGSSVSLVFPPLSVGAPRDAIHRAWATMTRGGASPSVGDEPPDRDGDDPDVRRFMAAGGVGGDDARPPSDILQHLRHTAAKRPRASAAYKLVAGLPTRRAPVACQLLDVSAERVSVRSGPPPSLLLATLDVAGGIVVNAI